MTAIGQLGVAVVGCGLIGSRRARTAALHPRTRLCTVVDSDAARAAQLAGGACDVTADWRSAIERDDVNVIVVSTPNVLLADVAVAALERGRHVLMEKPMGRTLAEAERIAAAATASGAVLQVGFNHRHHPAVSRARETVRCGGIGRLISIRARYGHGGRPGLEREWRSDPVQAGGGELIDQGVHVVDLIHWIAGMPRSAYALVQTAVWPISPLEDNAYGLLAFEHGVVAQLHVSMTQWKNLFSLELHGDAGAVTVEGLGGSYGVERLIHVDRAFQGGAPDVHEERFEGEDGSWSSEWNAFVSAIDGGAATAGPAEGVAAMRILEALYRSARAGTPVVV
ncbi:MAG: Gfo/Idh/MocA family oxidoreductase [Gemmatimonadota bacterium]